jgi:rare lipoprotein A
MTRVSGSALRRAIGAAALLVIVLAAGCSSVPVTSPPVEAPAPVPAPVVEVPPAPAAPPVAKPAPARPAKPAAAPRPAPAARGPRCGACYQDDGPGENPPAHLASIPDAVPRAEPLHPVANRPYTVFGRGYVPRLDLAPQHRERGHASWYGRKFHGRPTSSGERYDMYAMTAAHPTLPIPSYVRVTHLGNGRSVVVKVNDRGPFLNRRVIDLTYTAAWKLGYVESGSAEVEVELLSPAGPVQRPLQTAVRADVVDGVSGAAAREAVMPLPMLADELVDRLIVETTIDEQTLASPFAARIALVAPQGEGVSAVPSGPATWLQVGAFGSRENALAARARLQREAPWLAVPVELYQQDAIWRVQVGPWAHRDDALAAAERIVAGGGSRPIAVTR